MGIQRWRARIIPNAFAMAVSEDDIDMFPVSSAANSRERRVQDKNLLRLGFSVFFCCI